MKLLIWVASLWLLLAIVLGCVGDAWLTGRWRAQTLATFQRDVQMANVLLGSRAWQVPFETDPRWESLERSLELNIVPGSQASRMRPPAPAARDPSARVAADGDATDGLQATPHARPVELTWLAGGRVRLSTRIAEAPLTEQAAVSLQFTREVSGAGFRGAWWGLWGLTHLAAATFAGLGLRMAQQQLARQRWVLAPWLDALRTNRSSSLWLPPIEEVESELEPSLMLIAERVNRTLAELENSNQRSDLVLGNLQEGVLAVDQSSSVLLANRALRDLLEVQEEVVLNRPLLEVIRIPLVSQLVELVVSEQEPREDVLEFGTPLKSLRLLVKPLPLGPRRSGALLTVRDETLLKRIESMRRDFVANASHELKTPLSAIRAYAETLQLGALDDRAAAEQFVAKIIFQADRINGLVQGMLQLSRVQSGTALRIELFDAMEALEPCLAAIEALAKAKGIRIAMNVSDEPLLLCSDRDGFQTIVSNLLSNAVRYTPENGSAELTVRAEGDWLVVVVSDTGSGIRPADLERIFERFYRAEKDRSTDSGGTGLGLAIVKNLVQALGGSVSAASWPNQGSRFEVRLPLRRR